jgi:hypothetical protein
MVDNKIVLSGSGARAGGRSFRCSRVASAKLLTMEETENVAGRSGLTCTELGEWKERKVLAGSRRKIQEGGQDHGT